MCGPLKKIGWVRRVCAPHLLVEVEQILDEAQQAHVAAHRLQVLLVDYQDTVAREFSCRVGGLATDLSSAVGGAFAGGGGRGGGGDGGCGLGEVYMRPVAGAAVAAATVQQADQWIGGGGGGRGAGVGEPLLAPADNAVL